MRIIYNGVFDRHPGATLILGHMGELLASSAAGLTRGTRPWTSPPASERVFENRQVRASRLVMVVIMARWTMASWWSGLVS